MIEVIGTIYKGNHKSFKPNFVRLEGFHVNSLAPLEGCEMFEVSPETPSKIFLNEKTYFYCFENEAQFKQLVGYQDEAVA